MQDRADSSLGLACLDRPNTRRSDQRDTMLFRLGMRFVVVNVLGIMTWRLASTFASDRPVKDKSPIHAQEKNPKGGSIDKVHETASEGVWSKEVYEVHIV